MEENKVTEKNEVKKRAEKKVKLILPYVPGVLDSDEVIIVNGTSYLIKRGEEVEVPAVVKEILDNKTEQLKNAASV